MQLAHDLSALETLRGRLETAPALVPTMGALHEGHLALVRCAAATSRPVVVSVFVNPTQFSPTDDFERYPRPLEEDCRLAREAGADIVFAPDVDSIYPPGATIETPPLPAVATRPRLEDAHRPGHFAGVCQVVARLFDLVKPSVAVFGEKDYQQLLVIRALAARQARRWPHLEIVAHPTVRDDDGIALSSRNAYLSPAQRRRALGLSRAIDAARTALDVEAAERAMQDTLASHDCAIDYAVVRDATTLEPIESINGHARALIAARVDDVRLIDNGPFGSES